MSEILKVAGAGVVLGVWLALGNMGDETDAKHEVLTVPSSEYTIESGKCLTIEPGDRTIGEKLYPLLEDVNMRDFWRLQVAGAVALNKSDVIHPFDQLPLTNYNVAHLVSSAETEPC